MLKRQRGKYFILLFFLSELESLGSSRQGESGNNRLLGGNYTIYVIFFILAILIAIIIALAVSYVRLKRRVDDRYTVTSSSSPISSRPYTSSRSSGFTDLNSACVHSTLSFGSPFHGKHIKSSPLRSNASMTSMSSSNDIPILSPHKEFLNQDHSQHVYDNVGAIMY